MKPRILSIMLLVLGVAAAGFAAVADPSDAAPDADRNAPKLFVPYKDVPALIGPLDRAVLLQRDTFAKLLAAAEAAGAARYGAPRADDQRDVAQITRGDYQAAVEGEKLRFTGTLQIVSLSDRPVAVPLKFGQVGLTTVTLDAKDAPLGYDRNGRLVLIVAARGPHTLAVAGSAVLKDLAGGGVQFGMSVPTATAGAMALAAPGDLEVHATVPVSASAYDKAADKTNVTLTLGGHETLNVVLMGNGRQEDQRAILLGTSATTVQLTGAYQTLNCLYTVQVLRRGVRELTFALPGDWTITDVDCPALVNWSVVPGPKKGDDAQLVVRLRTASRGAKAVHIQASAPRTGPAAWASPYVKLQAADFQHGHLLVDTGREIAVRGQQLDRARREDLSSANLVPGLLAATQGRLFYHWSDNWSVKLDLAAIALRTSAEARHTAVISPEELSLTSQFDVTAIGRDLFDLTFDLPPATGGARWQLSGVSIDGKDASALYREVEAGGKRALKIALSSPVRPEGVTHVVLTLRHVPADWQWPAGAAPRDVDVPVPGIEADTVSGLLAVAPVGDLDASAETAPAGLRPVTVGRMASLGLASEVQLAYTYESPTAPPLRVHVQRRSPRLAADSIALVTARPTHLEGVWRINYNISRARERKLYLLADKAIGQALTITAVGHTLAGKDRVPPGKDTVVLSAALAAAYDLWQLTLDSQAAGDVAVEVRYDRPLSGADVPVPLVRPIGAAQINEMLALQASEELAVTVAYNGASEVDAVDLPPLPAPASRLLKAFRLDAPTTDAGAAAAISLTTKVHEKYVIPAALAADAKFTTYLGARGGQRTEATYHIANAGMQFLTVRLPKGAQLWSVRVAGQQAKPSQSAEGDTLVALPRSTTPQEVKVLYALPDAPAGDLRHVALGRADLPGVKINQFQWIVLPPPGYRLAKQFTNMETEAPFRPALAGESILEDLKDTLVFMERGAFVRYSMLPQGAKEDESGTQTLSNLHAIAPGEGRRAQHRAGRGETKDALAEGEKTAEEMAPSDPSAGAARDELVPIPLVLPKPRFSGTPKNLPPGTRVAPYAPAPTTSPAKSEPEKPQQDQAKFAAGKGFYYYRAAGRYTLPVDLTASLDAGPASTFKALGPADLEIGLASIADGRTNEWIGLAAVLLVGLLLVRRTAGGKATFIAVVLGLATLVAIWWPAGAYAANGVFQGALWLIPAYLVIGAVRWAWGKVMGRPAAVAAAAAMVLLAMAVLSAGQGAYAADEPAGKSVVAPEPLPLVVPYEGDPMAADKSDKILVSYARYVELWNLAHPDQLIELAAPPLEVSLAGVRYAASLAGERMTIVLTAQVRTFSRGWAVLPMPMSGLAVTEATLDGKPAQLQVGPKGMILTLPGRTTGLLQVTAVTTPKQLGRRGSVTMSLPPLPAAVMTLDLPAADLDLEAPGVEGALSKAPAEGGAIRWTIPLGIQRDVTLKWSPVVGAGAADRTLSAAAAHEVFAFHWAMVGVSRITYTFSAGTNERFGMLLPEGVTLTDLTGANLRDFREVGPKELDGVKYRVVEVRLHRPASKSFELTARWVGKLPAMDAPAGLPLPRAADVGRESGTVALFAAGGMSLKINSVVGGRRSAEGAPAAKAATTQAAEHVASYYWPYRPFALTVQLSRNVVSPTVRMDQLVRIDRQEVQLLVQATFSTRTGRIFGASFALPAGLELLSVVGPAVEDHYEQPTPTGRRLHVNFRAGVTETRIALVLVRKNPRLEDLTAPAVVAVDADGQELADQSGRLAVQVAASLDAQTLGSENLRPTPPRGVRGWLDEHQTAAVQFAYNYETPKFQLRLKVSPQATKVRLEVLGGLTVQPTTAWYSYRLRYQIEGTPIDTVRFTLPTRYAGLVAVNSPSLRSVTKAPVTGADAAAGRTEWTVALINEVTGTLDVAVNFAVPIDAATTTLEFPRIATPPGQGYRAVLAVQNASPHKLSLMDSTGMTPLPQSEQQQLLAEPVRKNLQFVFQSFTGEWSLLLGVKAVKATARVEAIVDLLDLKTIVDRSGRCRYEARLMLQNRTQQFLRVKVPAGLQLWSATVAGQPVKPVTDPAAAGVVLIPLVKTSPGGLPYDVILYLAGTVGETLGLIGEIRPPAIGIEEIPVQRTIWRLRLPSGYVYYPRGGNLSPATDEELQVTEVEATSDQLRRNEKSLGEVISSGSQRGRQEALWNREKLNKKLQYQTEQVRQNLVANPNKLSEKEVNRLAQKVADVSNFQTGLQAAWEQREKDQQQSSGDNNVNWFLNNDAGNGGLAENVRNGYLNSLPAFVRAAAEGQKQEITKEIASNEEFINVKKAPAEEGKPAGGKVAVKGTKGGGLTRMTVQAGELALNDQQILVEGRDQDKESQLAQVLDKLQDDQRKSQQRRQAELKGQLTLLGDNRLERFYGSRNNQAIVQPQAGQQAANNWGGQQMDQPQAPNVGQQSVSGNTQFRGGEGTLNVRGGTLRVRNGTTSNALPNGPDRGWANQPGDQSMPQQGQQRQRQQVEGPGSNVQLNIEGNQTYLGALDTNGRAVRIIGGAVAGSGAGGGGGTNVGQAQGQAQVVVTDGDGIDAARTQTDYGLVNLNTADAETLNIVSARGGLAVARGTYSLPVSLPEGGEPMNFQGPSGSPTVSVLAVDERLVDAAHNTGAVFVIALVVWLLGRLLRQLRRRGEPAGGGFLLAYVLLAAVLAALIASEGMGLVGGIVLFGAILCPVELVHRLLLRRAPRPA